MIRKRRRGYERVVQHRAIPRDERRAHVAQIKPPQHDGLASTGARRLVEGRAHGLALAPEARRGVLHDGALVDVGGRKRDEQTRRHAHPRERKEDATRERGPAVRLPALARGPYQLEFHHGRRPSKRGPRTCEGRGFACYPRARYPTPRTVSMRSAWSPSFARSCCTCTSTVDRARPTVEVPAPHPLEQLLAAEDLAGVAHQELQQVKLPLGERHLGALERHLAALRPQRERPQREDLVLLARGASSRTAEKGTHPADHLHHAKGLRQVVVRAVVERTDGVQLRVLGREHHDRNVLETGRATDALQNLKAIRIWQHNVKQHRLGHALCARHAELRVVREPLRLDTRLLQGVNRQLADVGVVFDVVDHVLSFPHRASAVRARSAEDGQTLCAWSPIRS